MTGITIARGDDKRNALVSWNTQTASQGYNVRWGIAPDKLYSSWMVYGRNSVSIRSLNVDQKYYFDVEAFDVHGVGPASKVIEAQ